jgi:hypothetical protein
MKTHSISVKTRRLGQSAAIVKGLGGTFTAFQGSASPIGGANQLPASIPGR